MNQWFKHIVYIVLIGLAFPQMLKAQNLGGAFIMSSVGSLQNMSNNSMSVIFSSNATCLNIQNGTAVMIGDRGTGSFAVNCEVDTKFNTLGINMYPNPVRTSSKVKFKNTPPLNDQFSISIWNTEGFRITNGKASGYDLFQGIPLDLSMLPAGNFIIQIESQKYKDALKFIKLN